MPLKQEKMIRKSAKKAGLRKGTKSYNAYLYGTLNKIKKRGKKKRVR